jgi:hypothetical protein
LVALFLLLASSAAAQDWVGLGSGRDGALVAVPDQVINVYSPLTAAVSPGATTVTVEDASAFVEGELLLLYQVQAGSFVTGDGGDVDLTVGDAGRYEFVRITAISGNDLDIIPPTSHGYLDQGAQAVKVPEYTTVTLDATASLRALPWDGRSGGVLAFLAQEEISNEGLIDASARGFRGGAVSNDICASPCNCGNDSRPVDDLSCNSGRRGEGIGLAAVDCGTGNRANGGGGGGLINAGGAGGGNGGAGSVGGNAWCSGNIAGGYPSSRLLGSLTERLSLGGGGGGGQQNNGVGTGGGNGGGLILIRGESLSGAGSIRANGAAAPQPANDGSGGGGAGGSILIQLSGDAVCGQVQADGGNGRSFDQHGGGGGGGGGRVLLQAADASACPVSVQQGLRAPDWSYPPGEDGDGELGEAELPPVSFGCEANPGCPGDSPVCDPVTQACRPCSADSECGGATPACVAGRCEECSLSNLSACDDSNPCTDNTCDNTTWTCSHPSLPSSSPCPGGVCDGGAPPVCELCIDTGVGVDSGCSPETPHCVGASGARSCVACTNNGHCNDGNDCSQDLCNSGVCSNPTLTEGTSCAGGVCNGLEPALCETCIDTGVSVDSGCSPETPHCIGASGARSCVACTQNEDCDDANDCTQNLCNAGACENPALPDGQGCATGICENGSCELCVDDSLDVDTGCSPQTPFCVTNDGARLCAACLLTEDCPAVGPCELSQCLAFACVSEALAQGEPGLCGAGRECSGAPENACLLSAPVIDEPAEDAEIQNRQPYVVGSCAPGASVSVFEGELLLCETLCDDDGRFVCQSSELGLGSHSVLALQSVDGEQSEASELRTFSIVEGPEELPPPSIDAPAPDGRVPSSNPSFSGTCEPGALVEVFSGEALLCTAICDSEGRFACSPEALELGPQTVFATQSMNGEISDASTSVSFTVVPPAPGLDSPVEGEALVSPVTFAGDCEPGALVSVSANGVELCSVVCDENGRFECTAPVPGGMQTISATQSQDGYESDPFELSFVSTPAAPTLETPAEGAQTDLQPVFTGSCEPGATVRVWEGEALLCSTVCDENGRFSCTPEPLDLGAHTVWASQTVNEIESAASEFTSFEVIDGVVELDDGDLSDLGVDVESELESMEDDTTGVALEGGDCGCSTLSRPSALPWWSVLLGAVALLYWRRRR